MGNIHDYFEIFSSLLHKSALKNITLALSPLAADVFKRGKYLHRQHHIMGNNKVRKK
jgi:hypothetical protein